MFQMNFYFLQNPWHTEAIHCAVYTSAELCHREKEHNHYGYGVQHDGSQEFAK